MSGTFQLNKVYSNIEINTKLGEVATNKSRFMTKLYNDHPELCPWPLAKKAAKKHCELYKQVFNYYYPTKRTKHFIYLMDASVKLQRRFKVRFDVDGNEFVIIDNIPLYASQMFNMGIDEAYNNYISIRNASANYIRFIEKLAEVEEFGYTYVTNDTKLTTIDEVRRFYNIGIA